MEVLPFFEKLGFPIAVCAVLFGLIVYFTKQSLIVVREYLKTAQEQAQKQQDFMVSVIKEDSQIIAACTAALNNFSVTLGNFCNVVERLQKNK